MPPAGNRKGGRAGRCSAPSWAGGATSWPHRLRVQCRQGPRYLWALGIYVCFYSQGLGAFILGSLSHWMYSSHSHITSVCIFFLMCFPSSFSATVINSNTPSLKRQSKLHWDLRRTIVCLYAQSINLNYQLSHYMLTIKQWHTQRLYSMLIYNSYTRDLRIQVVLDSQLFQIAESSPSGERGAGIKISFDNKYFSKRCLAFFCFL